MEYYLYMDGYSSFKSKITKLSATNMEDAKKETFIISLCDRKRYEFPEKIDFENFDSWLLIWLGDNFIGELAYDIIDQYELLKKECQNDNGMRECCKYIEVGYDYSKVKKSVIFEVASSDKNAIRTTENISEKIKTIALQKAKDIIEVKEREKLAELKKKYG